MFKRKPKHVFTCPDVIHLQKRAKKQQKIAIATNLLLMAGFWTAGVLMSWKNNDDTHVAPDTIEPPKDN